jgi:hypothetical protein
MHRIATTFAVVAVAVGASSTAASASSGARFIPPVEPSDVACVSVATRALVPGIYRATPTVITAQGRIPGGVFRAALLDDPDAFAEAASC